MTTKEIAARSGLSEPKIRALVAEKKLTRAGRNKFDPATAGWEIAAYWRAQVARANPGEVEITDAHMAELLRQVEAMQPGNGIRD